MLGSFILLVLYITGLIETAILLFGSPTNVSGNCSKYVTNAQSHGPTVATLAWLEQSNICEFRLSKHVQDTNSSNTGSCWDAAFAFWLVGILFFIWMLFMASQVGRGAFE
jgi:hypothetical protein